MKKYYLFLFLVVSTYIYSQKNFTPQSDYYFYENKGQIIDQKGNANSKVKFLFNSGGLNVQIKKEGFSYDVYEVEKTKKKKSKVESSLAAIDRKPKDEFDYKFKFHRVDIDFLNANKNPEIIAEGKSTDYENYYNIPNKPEGVTEVYRYQKITYKNIYPNVDLVFFKPKDTAKTIEYNFIIHPKGKISDIKLKFKGAKTKLKNGKLSMNLRFGEMQENIPHSWIEEPSKKTDLSVQFREIENGVFGFAAPQDSFDKTVVIDPVPTRIWGTYFKISNQIYSSQGVKAKNNNVYLAGSSYIVNNVATTNAYQTNGISEITYGTIQKFDSTGNRLWGTYIGNTPLNRIDYTYNNHISNFEINSNEEIFIVGSTKDEDFNRANNFTTTGAFKEKAKSLEDAEGFIVKFDTHGKRIWGTYFGGIKMDDIYNISLDKNEDLLICGRTTSDDNIATKGAYIESITRNSSLAYGFFANFSKNGNLIYSSYFYVDVNFIAQDNSENIIIGGQYLNYNYYNFLPNIGTLGTHQPNVINIINAYILKFDKNYNKLWGTYYGGNMSTYIPNSYKYNQMNGLQIGKNNDIYIIGVTNAEDNISTSGSYKETFHQYAYNYNGFIAKLNENGQRVWGTYFGFDDGLFDTDIQDFNLNKNDDLYIVGFTETKTKSKTPNAFLVDNLNYGYLNKFNAEGKFIWSTFYPTSGSVSVEQNNIYLISSNIINYGTEGTFMPNHEEDTLLLTKFQDCQNNVFVSANSPVCPNNDIKLEASGGTSYLWTGPNGFTSTDQNPIIPNATSVNSGTYSCTITGTGDCDGTYTVEVKVEDKTPPIPDVTNLPDITGDCHTVISTTPTATDNCSGKITATTTDALQYSIPGTYTITWKYDDGNGNLFTQTQKVIITSPALPTATSPQTFCAIDAPKISDIHISGQNIKWYDASGNVLNTATPLIDGTTYYASQTINGCESDKIPIQVKVNSTPLPTANSNQDFCTSRNAQVKDLVISGTSIKFYDNYGNLLNNNILLKDNTSYFATQTINNCESPKLEIKVTLTANSLPANDYNLAFCNDTTSNSKIEDLTQFQENLVSNSSTYIFEYFDQNNQKISDFKNRNLTIGQNIYNVKISTTDGCWKTVKLILQLNPKPVVTLPAEAEYCRGLFVELNAGSGYSSYSWNTGEKTQKISVNKEGTYTVKVTNASNCENTSSTLVKQSVLANILKVEIFNNNAKVLLSAEGDFEYSLNNINWQNSNEFKNLGNGNHTVFVRTKLGCIIGQMNFTIFNISNSFTPNGDGINDTWKIDGMENYPNSEVTVLDRQSTIVLRTITNGTFEWNGHFNGRVLPSGTYWYIIKVSDGRMFQGSLLIKNRN